MLESLVTRQILRWLNSIEGVRANKLWATPANKGEPDVYACWRGRAVFIEVKVPWSKPRSLQAHTLSLWRAAGAIAFYTTSLRETQDTLAAHGLCE